MKKIVSILSSASLLISSAYVAVAADREARQPDVSVNGTIVEFEDQCAYITDEGRTLVPARGVFEAMGCTVNWDNENYIVTVSNKNQDKNIILAIDDTDMKVVSGEEETIKTLEVPAQLMNNRTMIPLRAVSEALGCMIMWDEKNYMINISTIKSITQEEFNSIISGIFGGAAQNNNNNKPAETEIKDEDKMVVSIYSNADKVKKGEEFEVCVKLENADTSYGLGGVTTVFKYDKSSLEYVKDSGNIYDSNGQTSDKTIGVENVDYPTGTKIVFINKKGLPLDDSGYVYKCRFKKIKDGQHTLALSNEPDSDVGYETKITLILDGLNIKSYSGKNIKINLEPICIN